MLPVVRGKLAWPRNGHIEAASLAQNMYCWITSSQNRLTAPVITLTHSTHTLMCSKQLLKYATNLLCVLACKLGVQLRVWVILLSRGSSCVPGGISVLPEEKCLRHLREVASEAEEAATPLSGAWFCRTLTVLNAVRESLPCWSELLLCKNGALGFISVPRHNWWLIIALTICRCTSWVPRQCCYGSSCICIPKQLCCKHLMTEARERLRN